MLLCLNSFTLSIKLLHSFRVLWLSFFNIISLTLFEHVSLFNMSSSIVFIDQSNALILKVVFLPFLLSGYPFESLCLF